MISLKILLVAATLSSGNAELDSVSVRSAADIALARIRRDLATQGPEKGALAAAMLTSPGRFSVSNEAELACRILYSTAVDREYAERAAKLSEKLKLGSDFAPRLSDADRNRAMNLFPKRYAEERASACAVQAKKIALAIRPTEAEFETTDEDALRLSMSEKVAKAQKEPVFEENLAYISEKIVDPLIDDAKREMKRQREYLSRTRCESYAPSALAKELEANLKRNVEERRAKSKDPTKEWGIFPGTFKSTLPKIVEKRALDRVTRAVEDVKAEVDVADIAKRMAKYPALHYKASDSESHFRAEFASEIVNGANARAVQEAPSAERDEFAAYLKEHSEDPALTKAVDARVRRDLLPAIKKARAQISEDELNSRWPSLVDGSWHPDEAFADEVLARSDATQAIGDWRKLDEMSELTKGGKPLLEETGTLADKSVASAFDRARSALAAQNQLVEVAHPEVLADAKERKNSFFERTPDLKKVVELLTVSVSAKWTEKRSSVLWPDGKLPANAAEQYTELFPSVKKRIELVARQILEEMKPPEEKPPKPPEETPPEEPPEPKMEFSIVVEKKGGEVKVKLMQGKSALEDRAVKEDMTEFSAAMKAVADRLGKDLLKLK